MMPQGRSPQALRRTARRRRLLFFGLTFTSSVLASLLMLDILRANSLTLLEALSLVLFFGLFTWISGAFWTAIAGFVIRLKGGDAQVIQAHDADGLAIHSRIALVMPVYNEDPQRTTAGLDAIWSSLAAQAESAAFDLFILSDTRRSEVAAAEEAAWRTLVARYGAQGRIFYRRRAQNVGRKSGNIADFVRNWGAAYTHMIVLDADSVMSGEALVTLARLMDANPDVGIIQTAPLPVGRETLFARMVQFGARLNGPMLSSGLAWWQLGEANYWGHNAIIRLQAFAGYCDLPHLPGRAPLGGEILSHDFVEAAFMRRAGYKVWLVPDLMGSWEEVPSNIIAFAARDRRWAQGNLQHMQVLIMPQLHWLNRLHMITGILSYATSPMWFAVLVLSSIITCQEAVQGYQYFESGAHTLFPVWPEYRDGEIAALLLATIVVLLLPKVLGATLALVNGARRRAFGGAARLLASLLLEQLFSMLLAPPMMVFHTTFVVTTLAGKPVAWHAQDRGDSGVTFGDALARHRWQIALGIAWGTVILMLAPRFIWWMTPVLAGLLLSAFLTTLSSRVQAGLALRRHGLLLTPEETSPPPELAAMHRALQLPAGGGGLAAAERPPGLPGDSLQTPALAPLRMEPVNVDYPIAAPAP
ncbi:MAG TPA: glucans biosynthesis glucosyltransferase MdoH [Steroidobacteraceae bacterium]|nr:glucans biosynthesis glucosyltransferase MdoH [Steroidobacteraceae bacterium]